jgi:hypothetical protein
MPLSRNCSHDNPCRYPEDSGLNLSNATKTKPDDDHVFGAVVPAIEGAFKNIFGAGENWKQRMHDFNPNLATLWGSLCTIDFGHGLQPPVVKRTNDETDQHAYAFGWYVQRLQWQLCEIVCTNNVIGNSEERSISPATQGWKIAVKHELAGVMNNLVDETALKLYINNTQNAKPQPKKSQANKPQRNKALATNPTAEIAIPEVLHPPMSFAAARTYASSVNSDRARRVMEILGKFVLIPELMDELLNQFDGSGVSLVNGSWSKWES